MSKTSTNPLQGIKEIIDTKMNRRSFIKCSALLGGSLAASHYLARAAMAMSAADWTALDIGDTYSQYLPENQI